MNFQTWWSLNKCLYEPQNVTREIAYTIWSAAVDNYVIIAEQEIRKRFGR